MGNISERIHRTLSPVQQEILHEAGSLGAEMGYPTCVVGGTVRDLLLGLHSFDMDIVVEGEGIRYARSLAECLHARVKCHERFGTATLIFPDELRVDVATARTETYERAASLPRVTPGTIRDDLSRRDFTVNAMAASLMPGEFGRLFDYFRGIRDLRKQHIRILHDQSFIDDPTRIFRAIRFETRLGFRIVRDSEQRIAEALSRSILAELEDYRIAAELRLILEEPEPIKPLGRLVRLGVINALKERPVREKALKKQLKKAEQILAREAE
jgi:tRNA nucleotidyltransferase (CCA-adding enzyme)